MEIHFLRADYGDCIWINFTDDAGSIRNIVIDGGPPETYEVDKNEKGKPEAGALQKLIIDLKRDQQKIDLLIITHIDDDHIGGILKWFSNDTGAAAIINDVWFNSGKLIADTFKRNENKDLNAFIKRHNAKLSTSIDQGIEFGQYIFDNKIWNRDLILQGMIKKKFGLTFKILSPNKPKLDLLLRHWKKKDPNLNTGVAYNDYGKTLKEHLKNDTYTQDGSYPNGSSIAFLIEYKERKFLFLGDSHPAVIVKGMKLFNITPAKPVKVDLVKLSHHGSKGNTSKKLLQCIEATDFLISTDGKGNQHPNKQLLARLIGLKPNANLLFNYPERMAQIFSGEDKTDFPDFSYAAVEVPLTF